VVHACNPSYLGRRAQEDCGWKPAWANSAGDPISKKLKALHKKKGWWSSSRCSQSLSSSPSTEKKERKREREREREKERRKKGGPVDTV
jgi:hypothetical protein